jgi:uncharacterized protein YxjI
MNYPISFTFKLAAFASKIAATDTAGNEILFVQQKAFKLKEDIRVYSNESKKEELFVIKADRIIDFGANYHFYDVQGNDCGSVKREGMASLWKATYNISQNGTVDFQFKEENAWVKVLDALLGEIPILGMLTGYFFNPSYILSRVSDGSQIMRLKKEASFFGRRFRLDMLNDQFDDTEEMRLIMSVLIAMILERRRG